MIDFVKMAEEIVQKTYEYENKVNEALQLKQKWIETVTKLLPIIEPNYAACEYLKKASDDIAASQEIDYSTKALIQSFCGVFWIDNYLQGIEKEREAKRGGASE